MLTNTEYTSILKADDLDDLITNQSITIDRTAPDGCHCATDLDNCGDGCINNVEGGALC
jgi:hypothetical protein